ncbi:MAG: pyridoxamine 5'-phosphate oxidase family protein [Nocardioides sp.]|nr:pyridoxamine 5'-phosphate oxidase family protein [Nocardioides sp.]
MSIPVDLAGLAATLADHPEGYLLTTSPEGRVKAVTVPVSAADGVVHIAAGSRGTAANLAANPNATLLFPPLEHHGYTLLVDGTAAPEGEGFRLTPTSAVLHRPASHADGETHSPHEGCGHDCKTV